MTEDEKLVREMWEETVLGQGLWIYEAKKLFELRMGGKIFKGSVKEKDAVWREAADFTRQRLQEIAELEKEIAVISFWSESPKVDQTSMRRTLKRLTDWRDEKKRGMR